MTDGPPNIKDAAPFDVTDQLSVRLAQLGQEHCVFARHERLYAVSVSAAREVLIGEPPTPVPQAPPMLVGVLNLRGEVLPLVQFDMLIGMRSRAYTADDQILVLSCNGVDLGLVVDRVREVRPIEPNAIATIPSTSSGHRLFKGCWQSPQGTITILDADGLVAAAVAAVSKGFRDRHAARTSDAAISNHS